MTPMQINMSMQPNVPYKGQSHKVDTPDGKIFVNVVEDEDGKPMEVFIFAGKAGTPVYAWANMAAGLITALLEHGVSVHEIIELLKDITSSGSARLASDGYKIRSGPEGIWYALVRYNKGNKRDD